MFLCDSLDEPLSFLAKIGSHQKWWSIKKHSMLIFSLIVYFKAHFHVSSNWTTIWPIQRDLTELLQWQVYITSASEIDTHPFKANKYSDLLNLIIELRAVPADQNFIEECTNRSLFWKCKPMDGIHSVIGCVQLFMTSPEYQNAGSLVFYPINITLLNFLEESCRSRIVEYATVCAYLSVRYDATHIGEAGCNSPQDKPTSSIEILKQTYESIAFDLEKIRQTTLVGLNCTAADGRLICFYLLISFYVADIPDCKDL